MHRPLPALLWLVAGSLMLACSSSSPSSQSSAGNGSGAGGVTNDGGTSPSSAGNPAQSGRAGMVGSTDGGASSAASGGAAGAPGESAGTAGQQTAGGSSNGGANSGGVGGGESAGGSGAGGPSVYPPATTMHRAIGVHDPSMIQVGATYYLFATGGLLNFRSSTNLSAWSNAGTIFTSLPSWITTELGQTITDLWAPDISYENGVYRVYYAGSVFGSNHSVIGLATNATLDSKSPDYKWIDQGLVIESNETGGSKDDWNAIDPNFIADENGNSWLVFGSFWSGIKLRRLDATTGKLSTSDTTLYSLANNANGIEAASIVYHAGYYYLFVSYDACCKGVNSTYRTMVGRAANITGPYSDNNGKPMLQGNALQLLATDGRYIGPGGGTAFRDGSLYYYAYHYYDGQANGASFLMLRGIGWTSDGWPSLMTPLWE